MITLNIIPANLKKKNKMQKIYKSYRNFLIVAFVMFMVFGLILTTFEYTLHLKAKSGREDSGIASESIEKTDSAVMSAMLQLDSIKAIQEEHVNWSELIEIISDRIPEGIKIKTFRINRANSSIQINGFAAKRDDLLRLKESLEELTFFQKVDFPLQNILEKYEINFEITANIKSYEFKTAQQS